MAKAILYIKSSQADSIQSLFTDASTTVVDNNWTNIKSNGRLLDGTQVRYAQEYNPAYFDGNGAFTYGTLVDTYGQSAVTTPGVQAVDLGSPAAPDNTSIHAAVTLTGTTQTISSFTTTGLLAGRTLRFKGNQASVTGNIVITGWLGGVAVTETLAISGTTAVDTVNAYDGITSVVMPAQGAGGDTISIGLGAAAAIGFALKHNSVFRTIRNGTAEATAPTVATDSAVVSKNVITPNTAFNGTSCVFYCVTE